MIRLLIADDEKLEREALADMVSRRFEHEVVLELAENGRKAADTAVLWGADLILMDIEMPGMSGLDAARAVLAQRPACRVIFVTAYSLFQYAHEAVHLGACDYLLKPVDPDELEASIRRAMRQIEAERKLEELARTTELSPEPETPGVPENPEEDAPEAESPEGENSQTAMVMIQVRRYLEDNYMFDLSLDSVGEILHISPAYLSAQFKKYQKMNFLDCLTELRINAAKELLADAGVTDGSLNLTILCDNDETRVKIAQVIKLYLAEVGINAEITSFDQALWNTYQTDPTKFDINISYNGGWGYITRTWNQLDSTRYEAHNMAMVRDDTLDNLIHTAQVSQDAADIDAAKQYMTENAFHYGLYRKEVYGITSKAKVTEAVYDYRGNLVPGACTYVWN